MENIVLGVAWCCQLQRSSERQWCKYCAFRNNRCFKWYYPGGSYAWPETITADGCTSVTAYGIEYSTTNGFANGSGTQEAGSNLSAGNFLYCGQWFKCEYNLLL
jgi:hypothetical protein